MPLNGYQGQRNEPVRVLLVAEELAQLRETPVEDLLPVLHANLLETFPRLKAG